MDHISISISIIIIVVFNTNKRRVVANLRVVFVERHLDIETHELGHVTCGSTNQQQRYLQQQGRYEHGNRSKRTRSVAIFGTKHRADFEHTLCLCARLQHRDKSMN
jgi:hypothetical protein